MDKETLRYLIFQCITWYFRCLNQYQHEDNTHNSVSLVLFQTYFWLWPPKQTYTSLWPIQGYMDKGAIKYLTSQCITWYFRCLIQYQHENNTHNTVSLVIFHVNFWLWPPTQTYSSLWPIQGYMDKGAIKYLTSQCFTWYFRYMDKEALNHLTQQCITWYFRCMKQYQHQGKTYNRVRLINFKDTLCLWPTAFAKISIWPFQVNMGKWALKYHTSQCNEWKFRCLKEDQHQDNTHNAVSLWHPAVTKISQWPFLD
jgi:hypothetical protein